MREVREETGITGIRIDRTAYVTLLNKNSELPDVLIVYLCETDTDIVKLSFEHQAFVWADERQCRELLPKAIIRDFENNNVFEILNMNK